MCSGGIVGGGGIDGLHSCESGSLSAVFSSIVGLFVSGLRSTALHGRAHGVVELGHNTLYTDEKDSIGLLTSLTTVLWSLRSGLGAQFPEFGGGRRGGLEVR